MATPLPSRTQTPNFQADPLKALRSPGVNSGFEGFTPTEPAAVLPRGRVTTPMQPLAPSIPTVGDATAPASFDELEASFQPEKKPGLLSSLARGVADIALQPARFLERAGKGLGIGLRELVTGKKLTEAERKAIEDFYGPGLQESVANTVASPETAKEYATPAYKNARQASGGALQAAANLTTPFGASLPSIAAQGIAYGAGKALEDERSDMDVLKEGVIGGVSAAALGKLFNVGGAVLGKGFRAAAPEIQKAFRPIAEAVGPTLTGLSRKEFNTAFKTNPHILLDYMRVVKDAASPVEAEGILQGRLLQNVREVMEGASKKEGSAFAGAVDNFNAAHPEARVDIAGVAKRTKDALPSFGDPASEAEQFALNKALEIVQRPREYTVNGARTLLQDLYAFGQRLEPGSPARRLVDGVWSDVRKELSNTTNALDNGAFDAAMARYSDFKDAQGALSPIFSDREDTARSFVRNLTGGNKTAAYEALVKLDKLAGEEGEAAAAIQLYNLMKKLTADGKITGSRVQDIMISGGAVSGLTTLGSMVAGPPGAALGAAAGSLLGARAMAPSTITNIMLSELKTAGIRPTSAVRQSLERILNNPALRNAILQSMQQGKPEGEEMDPGSQPLPSAKSFDELEQSFGR